MITHISHNLISNRITHPSSSTHESALEDGRTVKNAAKKENRRLREPANVNFCGFFASAKMHRFYQNNKFHKVLEFAKDQQLVFSATFALVLTCILRPAAIILHPSKKNKNDQKYASAHSIASGLIGFGISTVLFLPIGNAIKRFGKEHEDFLKAFGETIKENSYLKNEANYKIAKTFIDRAPDIITAIPKGILTVALIPPILKYVFGIEKKKSNTDNQMAKTDVDYSLLNFKQKSSDVEKAFKGGVQ